MSDSRPINVGFIGLSATGWAAVSLAPALLDPRLEEDFKLVAVSTSSPSSAAASAKKYSADAGNEVKAYSGSSANIASDPDVDLVAVSIKAPLHREVALPALERGKNLFIEWPVGKSLQETIEIGEVARKNGITKPFVNLNARNSLVVRKIKQLIDSGAIGKVRSSTFVATTVRENGLFVPWVQPTYRYTLDKEQGATLLIICIGHQLDAITSVLGDFQSVTASAAQQFPLAHVLDSDEPFRAKPTPQVVQNTTFDHYTFSGQLKSGAHSTVVWRAGAKSTPGRKVLQWEIDGEDGLIRVESSDTPFLQIGNPNVYLNGEKVEVEGLENDSLLSPPAAIQVHSWKEFSKGPKQGTYASIEDAIRIKKTLEAVEQSAVEGRTINL